MRKLFLAVLLVSALRVGAVSVTAIRCPDGGVQPQAVADASGKIHLIYLKGEDGASDVFYITSTDGGKTWAKPIRVNSQPGAAIATGTVRGAQIALGKGNRVHVAWMGSSNAQPKAPGDGVPMLYARLNDAGDAFEPQRNLITKAVGLDGGGSIAADPNSDRVAVAWHAPVPGTRGEENRTVWVSVSQDAGEKFAPETRMFDDKTGACGCCGMRLGMDARGNLLAIYRAVGDTSRAIDLAAEGARPLSIDAWATKTCPMSTAAYAQAADGALMAWETAGQVRFARIERGNENKVGAPISAPGNGNNRKHPSVAINKDGSVLLAWTEGTGWKRGGTLHWQLFDNSLKPEAGEAGSQRGLVAWSLPTAVAQRDGGFVVIY